MTEPAPRKRAPRPGEGRPTKYSPKFCERLIQLMATEGLSIGAVAGDLGVSRDTLYEWAASYPEFSYAKKLGEAKAQLYWERELGKIAKRGGGPGAAAAGIFALKNRASADWRDKQELDATVNGKVQLSADDAFRDIILAMEFAGRAKARGAGGPGEVDSDGETGSTPSA